MPKQVYNISRFEGGINNSADPRDIAENELVEARDVTVDNIGRIKMLGGFTEHESTLDTVTNEPGGANHTGVAGTGLFTWSSDYTLLNSSGAEATSTVPNYADFIALYTDASNARIAVFQHTSDYIDWGASLTDNYALGGASAKFSFYAVNGNLRIFDYSNTDDNVAKWLGVVTPKTYLLDSVGDAREYGDFETACLAQVYRTGTATAFKPTFVNQRLGGIAVAINLNGCFPEVDNDDGDSVAHNAIAHSVYSTFTSVTRTNGYFTYIDEYSAGKDRIVSSINGMFRHFAVGDKISATGFDTAANNISDVQITEIDSTNQSYLQFNAVTSAADEDPVDAWRDITVKLVEDNSASNQVAGAGFANEFTDIGTAHDTGEAAASDLFWGAGLFFGEDSDGNNTGQWMPKTTTRYKFYITTVYDDGTQESLPQLMAMYGSKQLAEGGNDIYDMNFTHTTTDDGGASSELYFSLGKDAQWQTTTTHSVQGEMIALHLKPYVKLNGAAHGAENTNTMVFGNGDVDDASTAGNPRISGVRYYWASSEDGYSELWRIFDCDFAKGTKSYGMDGSSGIGGRAPWQNISLYPDSSYHAANGHYAIPDWDVSNKFTFPPRILTYETWNHHEHTDTITLDSARSFAFAHNTVYAGNVTQTIDGQPVTHSDRILKSIVGQYDKFPSERFIQSAVNDGDEIIALATFGDRLLQFNKQIMYIINISQVDEFPEGKFKGKGVPHECCVCTTDKGIAWANENGAYFFDGQQVFDLLEKSTGKIIDSATWATFSNIPSVGYIPDKRQLIFVESHDASGNEDAYIYNLTTKSWTFASSGTVEDAIITNFINDYDGNLIYYDYAGEKMQKWDSAPDSSSNFQMITKDVDFGSPSIRKKIYKVYISYKGDASAVELRYSINGDTDTPTTTFYRTQADGSSDGTNADSTPLLNVGTDDWVNAELKPTASINNIYSFQLYFDGEAAADFEINDISIVYRMKSIK